MYYVVSLLSLLAAICYCV